MQRNQSTNALYSTAFAAGLLTLGAVAQAAPATYQAAVTANNPYVYYRLQETGTLTDTAAQDSSLNMRADGIYRGNPVGGIVGAGPASDTAVSFPGATNTGLDYLRTTDTMAFGSQVDQSSYELVFKTNVAGLTGYQSVFGVFNQSDATTTPTRTNLGAVAIELNSNATGNLSATTSRFYVRDEDGIALGATIANAVAGQYDLLDGNYHHLVFTYDVAGGVDNYVAAYVDGLRVPVSHVHQGGGNSTNVPDNLLDFTRDPVFGARNLRGVVGNEANVTIDEAALYGSVIGLQDVQAHATAAGFVVPEPTSLALAGIAGLGLMARRRRQV